MKYIYAENFERVKKRQRQYKSESPVHFLLTII